MTAKNAFDLTMGQLPSNRKASSRKKDGTESARAKERAFVESAATHSLPKDNNRYPGWEQKDPEERRVKGINVKFNEHELGLLHAFSKLDKRSVQYTITEYLMPAVRAAYERSKATND